ncbi:MAG: phosphate acyltransferase PlsX [Eubacteriales bacterium]|nr:phosphate acyltransferase PlsX [Eubacteriales bacterium]
MIKVVLDAFGGDNCPGCNIDGAINALKEKDDLKVILTGDENILNEELKKRGFSSDRLEIVNAPEVISLDESPVSAVRKKKESSLVKGIVMVKEGEADAFVSAGSSGAVLAGGQLLLGRLPGVQRPPLGTLIPTAKGVSFFLDMGANVDAKAEWLLQFAKMGSIYMKNVEGLDNPTVKLVNIGLEDEKGNALTKEVNELLKNDETINYQGYCEAREVPHGTADVIVADAFTGNAMIKMFEGTAGLFLTTMKKAFKDNLISKIGALLVMKSMKKALKPYDVSNYGGAPLLGVKGVMIKCHGNSKEKEIKNSVIQAYVFAKSKTNDIIAKAFEKV